LLTTRKRVGPLPASKLASRHALPLSSDHRTSSSSSSSDSSPCAAPLSTLYPPTTSESSSGDSSERPIHLSSHSARPSRKRCRSLLDYVPSSTPVIGSLALTRADLLPPQTEVDMELGIGDGYEADTSAGDTVEVGIDPMSAPIVKEEIIEPAGKDPSDLSGTRDGIVRSFENMPIDLDDAVRDFYHHMSEVRIDRIVGIKTF
ncbi:hypothetical protein Tco_1084562, partial [Tanacetum coccineum]